MSFMDEQNNNNEQNNRETDPSDNFEFVTETIKKRPVNIRKIVRKILFTLFLAILFAIVASFVFAYLYPVIKEKLYPDDGTFVVSLPEPSEYDEEENPENGEVEDNKEDEAANGSVDKAEQNVSEIDEKNNDEADTVSDVQEDVSTEPGSEENPDPQKNVVVNNIVETIEKDLEIEDYRNLFNQISDVAKTVQNSLVTVSNISSGGDWYNDPFEKGNSSIGLIFADNGKELLILSPTRGISHIVNVKVTFVDGNSYLAKIKKSDSNTGLCVVGVELEKISESTKECITKAEFGGVAASSVGSPVIAVGAPYGTEGSYAIGQITSTSICLDKTDTNVGIISTNIYASATASGVLANCNGKVVGIICNEDIAGDMPNLLRAYPVTDMTDSIEKLSNGQGLAKLGIYGTDVTKEANSELNVPFGTYVKEVIPDSPAMNVGFRNGDVIVKIGTTEIRSFSDYKAAMLKCHPGDIVVVTIMRPGREEYTEVSYEVTLEEM